MGRKKKSAAASLDKLSRGLTRETPVTRTATAETVEGSPKENSHYGGEGTSLDEATTTVTRKGRPRTKTEKMVRVSVDLSRSDHKWLRDFAYDVESDNMSVMRALLQELRADSELGERVLDRLPETER